MKFEPYLPEEVIGPVDKWCRRFSIMGGLLLCFWWAFPWMIPVRFGRWLFVSLGLMGCSNLPNLIAHEEKHCAGFAHQVRMPGQDAVRYEWYEAWPGAPKPWVHLYVDDPDQFCRRRGTQAAAGMKVQACAMITAIGCTIVLPKH